ncbi:MAG: hypothetical protein L6R39_000866 [Caloplaca ligustica]|nr:MAG: hypothetical protein L6R39_000866 [Caloplaca ligustica]
MPRAPRITMSLSLEGQKEMAFDPWVGFSDFYIVVSSSEETTEGDPPLLVEYYSPAIDGRGFDARWAIARGLLLIRDQDGKNIPINYVRADPARLNDVQYLRGARRDCYGLHGFKTTDLLQELRRKLVAGKMYTVELTDRPFAMQACYMEPDQPRLQPGTREDWINVQCSNTPVPFKVLAAASIPRFTASISTSSDTCHADSVKDFTLAITVTSLSRMPVEVSSTEFNKLSYASGIVMDKDAGEDEKPSFWGHPGKPDFELGSGSYMNDDRMIVTLPYGGTCTSYWRMTWAPRLTRLLRIRLIVDYLRILGWNYADLPRDIDADDKAKWPSKGYIEMEPVYHGWDAVESMLEAARPMPFFTLPRELRHTIYDYVKFAKGVGEVSFTCIANPQSRFDGPRHDPFSKT